MAERKPPLRLVSSRPIPRKWLGSTSPWNKPRRTRRIRLTTRIVRLITIIVLAVVAALAGRFASTPEPPVAVGQGALVGGVDHVTDGDTLDLRGQRIRLEGMDAPEHDQTCGREGGGTWDCGSAATARMAELVRGATVTCDPHTHDVYGRIVATCSTEAADLGSTMVAEGLAVSTSRYGSEQDTARASKRGIWQGDFMLPVDWRHRSSTDPATPLAPGSGNPSRFEQFWRWLTSWFHS